MSSGRQSGRAQSAPVRSGRARDAAVPRRGEDPIRITTDHRVAYWPSGVPGMGKRRFKRTRDANEAARVAEQLRAELNLRATATGRSLSTYQRLAIDCLAYDEAVGTPTGSIKQYRSNWNTWMPRETAFTGCNELTIMQWTEIFDGIVENGGSESTVLAVARTLGHFHRFGLPRGFFVSSPFAPAELRRAVVKKARQDAANENPPKPIELRDCPTPAAVDAYADELERLWPGYGQRFVLLDFATGLRAMETLGLRDLPDDKSLWDPVESTIAVNHQLDRYVAKPTLTGPKYGKRREALAWQAYADVIDSLVADAKATDGWWFPANTHHNWANTVDEMLKQARAAAGWDQNHHWTRHAYASWSLAPREAGGYGWDVQTVSDSLGHSSTTVTNNTYRHAAPGARRAAVKASGRRPGKLVPSITR